jgi:hypothetical protein
VNQQCSLVALPGLIRPELATVGEEIIAEIRRTIPEYARPLDWPYGHAMRIGVEQALLAFVDHVADPGTRHERRDDVCRKLGQNEALEGRSLDSLQSAYRVGVRVAWQRMMRMGRRQMAWYRVERGARVRGVPVRRESQGGSGQQRDDLREVVHAGFEDREVGESEPVPVGA